MGHSMAGDAGLEPTHARVKVWCLTDLANPQLNGVSGGIRTPDTRLRRPVLYPTELQTHDMIYYATAFLERKTGFEPATLALARRCSTTEPLPRSGAVGGT